MMNRENKIPSMTHPMVHAYLEEIGSKWQGKGCAMELGVWMGASSAALLRGLVKAEYHNWYWGFDKFIVQPNHKIRLESKDGIALPEGYDTTNMVSRWLRDIYPNVRLVKGDIVQKLEMVEKQKLITSLVEICLFDAPKKEPMFSDSMRIVSQRFIPGVTVLGLLDYNYHLNFEGLQRYDLEAPVRFIKRNKESFQLMKAFPGHSPAFFKYIGGNIRV